VCITQSVESDNFEYCLYKTAERITKPTKDSIKTKFITNEEKTKNLGFMAR